MQKKSCCVQFLTFAVIVIISSSAMSTPQTMIENRLRGALWGMFSGDALASPTHWY